MLCGVEQGHRKHFTQIAISKCGLFHTPLRNAFSIWRNGKDNPAHIFLTLDIEHDGFASLLVNDGVCQDAGDEEESE